MGRRRPSRGGAGTDSTAAVPLLVALGLVSIFMLATWIMESGVLPWAILGGALVSVAMWRLLGELGAAFFIGISTTAVIALMGIMSVVSPGWYRVW